MRTVVQAVPPGSARDAGGPGLAVVGQSLGGLLAPIVAERCAADLLVLVAPMVPRPGETGGEWWAATGQGEAMQRFAVEEGRDPDATDDETIYLHDVPASVRAELLRRPVEQTDGPFLDPWPLDRWPDVPTRVVAGREDRLFPLDFTTTLARERAGVEPDVIDTGHLPALADPNALVDLLDRYAREIIGRLSAASWRLLLGRAGAATPSALPDSRHGAAAALGHGRRVQPAPRPGRGRCGSSPGGTRTSGFGCTAPRRGCGCW